MFWLGFGIGCFIGSIVGFFTAALCAAESRGSMDDYVYLGRRREK